MASVDELFNGFNAIKNLYRKGVAKSAEEVRGLDIPGKVSTAAQAVNAPLQAVGEAVGAKLAGTVNELRRQTDASPLGVATRAGRQALQGESPTALREMPQALSSAVQRLGESYAAGAVGESPMESGLTTKVLSQLEGRGVVSKRFILDSLKQQGVKSAESELIKKLIASEGPKVNVPEFASKVRAELLPLKRGGPEGFKDESSSDAKIGIGSKYQYRVLPSEIAGDVAKYSEHVYESPIKTSAGETHFSGGSDYNTAADILLESNDEFAELSRKSDDGTATVKEEDLRSQMIEDYIASGALPSSPEGYFAHTRVEDMADGTTRRVIEAQSDLMQKGRLESSVPETPIGKAGDMTIHGDEQSIAKLEPYRNTWHERIVREEVKQAAIDGKSKLQFPTGETAMKIEGIEPGSGNWRIETSGGSLRHLEPKDLKVGREVNFTDEPHIITEASGDGKFKAIPSEWFDEFVMKKLEAKDKEKYSALDPEEKLDALSDDVIDANLDARTRNKNMKEFLAQKDLPVGESFDVSLRPLSDDPIYKFYESEMGKYLKKEYGAVQVTDAQGVKWWQVDVRPEHKGPIKAFGIAPPRKEEE